MTDGDGCNTCYCSIP